jgi:hypothetical protein
VVELVHRNMQVDEEWSLRQERGFCWWGHEYAQRIWAEPGYDDDGIVIYRVHAEADVVRDIEITPSVLEGLAALNTMTILSALVAEPEERKVQYRASMWVHEQSVDWVARLFQFVVAVQAANANAQGALLAGVVGGTPDRTAHPVSGERPSMDDMLLFTEQIVVPAGSGPSRWAGQEMADLSERWVSRFAVLASGDEHGLTEEFPYLHGTSLLQVTTDEPHPALGTGMLIRLSLPEQIADSEGPAWANDMNRLELGALKGTSLLGSWTVVNNTPTFVAFYPNTARLGDGFLTNIVMNVSGRAKRVAETRGDDWERPGRIDEAKQRKYEELRGLSSELGLRDVD